MAAVYRVSIFMTTIVLGSAIFKKGSKQLAAFEQGGANSNASFGLLESGTAATPATPALLAAEPVKWLHIPKAGTSFLNVVIHLPGLCPKVNSSFVVDREHLGQFFEMGFWNQCTDLCDTSKFYCKPEADTTHMGIGSLYETQFKGKIVMLMRDPLQRILSAFYDPNFSHGAKGMEPKAYAWTERHAVTCQIMRDGIMDPVPSFCGDITEAEAKKASVRLREGFAFLGIMEEWDLSICLFHRIFGGDCLASDFQDTRPNLAGADKFQYDESVLSGYDDPIDRLLYNTAKEVFAEKLLAYNVNQESCQPCFAQAGRVPAL